MEQIDYRGLVDSNCFPSRTFQLRCWRYHLGLFSHPKLGKLEPSRTVPVEATWTLGPPGVRIPAGTGTEFEPVKGREDWQTPEATQRLPVTGINSAQNFRDLPHWLISYHCTFWMAPRSEAYSRVLRSNYRLRGIETNSIPVHDKSAITFGAINCVAFYKCHSHSPPTRPVGETLRAPGRVNLRQQYARMNIKLLNEPCKMISYTGAAALKHWLLIQLLNEEQPRI